jgi:hypothetical protein
MIHIYEEVKALMSISYTIRGKSIYAELESPLKKLCVDVVSEDLIELGKWIIEIVVNYQLDSDIVDFEYDIRLMTKATQKKSATDINLKSTCKRHTKGTPTRPRLCDDLIKLDTNTNISTNNNHAG